MTNNLPTTLEVVKDIYEGMVNDVNRCLTIDESGGAAWLGGGLLVYCYIETLGHLFLENADYNWQYSKAFIKIYMTDFGEAIEKVYGGVKGTEIDVYRRFIGEFRNGLVHQYFPKGRGLLEIDYQITEPDVFIRKHPAAGDERILVSLRNLHQTFINGADKFLKDIADAASIEYMGETIDVRENCRERLEQWLEEALTA